MGDLAWARVVMLVMYLAALCVLGVCLVRADADQPHEVVAPRARVASVGLIGARVDTRAVVPKQPGHTPSASCNRGCL